MENLIYKCIVGSQAYGTQTPQSDTDYKGVFIIPNDEILSDRYKEQINVTKDETYYEVGRLLRLLQTGNPTVLEMLFSPEDCIITTSPQFELIKQHRDLFITKMCAKSFGGYAVQQIKKARGLDKKMNWEQTRVERKTPLDFMYCVKEGKSIPVTTFLKNEGLHQEHCGLVKLDHVPNTYAVYYDHVAQYGETTKARVPLLGYKGIIKEDSNEPRLSSIPKYQAETPLTTLYYNKDGYSTHCKDYNSYQEWITNRNTTRYTQTQLNQKIDGKNLMHCRRLLDTALEIVEHQTISVRRPNKDYLLSIRRGEVELDQIIGQAELDIKKMDDLFSKSTLPDSVNTRVVEDLLLKLRKM